MRKMQWLITTTVGRLMVVAAVVAVTLLDPTVAAVIRGMVCVGDTLHVPVTDALPGIDPAFEMPGAFITPDADSKE